MDRLAYTAAAGAARMLEQQAIISHNMANVSTVGFREQLALFRAVPVVAAPALATRVSTVSSTPGSRQAQGAMVQTGNSTDAAIAAEGWFSVQAPDGHALTRAGEFSVDASGLLVNRQGWPVLDENGALIRVPRGAAVAFSEDGQISVIDAANGEGPQVLGKLRLVNPPASDLERGADGLFRLRPGRTAEQDAGVRIVPGHIEQSNVSAALAMVGMIANARQFDMQMKVIQDASINAERANSILSPG